MIVFSIFVAIYTECQLTVDRRSVTFLPQYIWGVMLCYWCNLQINCICFPWHLARNECFWGFPRSFHSWPAVVIDRLTGWWEAGGGEIKNTEQENDPALSSSLLFPFSCETDWLNLVVVHLSALHGFMLFGFIAQYFGIVSDLWWPMVSTFFRYEDTMIAQTEGRKSFWCLTVNNCNSGIHRNEFPLN